MAENRDEGDRREGTTRENEECSAANNGILLGEKFSSVSLLGDPVKLHPRSLALHPAPPSMVPGVPVIFRNIAESRGGPVAELAGYPGGSVNRFRMERKTGYTVQGVGNGRRSSSQAK